MKHALTILLILGLLIFPAEAQPLTVDEALVKSMELAADKEYEQALAVLEYAQRRAPDDNDLKVAQARIYSWEGRYDLADAKLRDVLASDPNNTDAQLANGYLDYYQGHLEDSEKTFTAIVGVHPDNADAQQGLNQVQNAAKAAEGYRWVFDAGYEHSSFSRHPQPNWANEFAQVTHLFDHGDTAVHARFEYYDQFLTTDTYYELGVDHIFTPYLNGYLYAGHTVDASFRPTWRLSSGGSVRLDQPEADTPVFWLTLDAREDEYNQLSFLTFNPGGRAEFSDWALSANLVMVRQWGMPSVYGWNTRLDTPNWDGFHFSVGYSNAPDVENAVSDYTASFYGGASYDLTEAMTFRLGYTHDDRQNSYIRHVIDASVTIRY